MKSNYYTAGELARLGGVSLRAIRFYDKKGLLKPVFHTEAGYRCYDQTSLTTLQNILMFKYLGFSLEQIAPMLTKENDFPSQLSYQKKLLQEKKRHLEKLIATIETAEYSQGSERQNALLHLLHLMTDDDKVREQYKTATNLEHRISLHDYSTSEESWFDWVYRHMQLSPGQEILELGCGTGALWAHNAHKFPDNLHLTLTDRSEGMLAQTRDTLMPFSDIFLQKRITLQFQVLDANAFALPSASYDCIIANHMLYHVHNRDKCLEQISLALRPEGNFYCTTVGDMHFKELHHLVAAFDSSIEIPFQNMTVEFRLENAAPQLEKYFSHIIRRDQDNNLLVDNAEAICNYVRSCPGNARYILEQKGDDFLRFLQKRIDENGPVFIRKSAGMFICRLQ
ncbi:MAG: MerR family transcriptional regulator [Roseburia sp.]|nr:MerR family transcriptional regulator [Roseburia sp.]